MTTPESIVHQEKAQLDFSGSIRKWAACLSLIRICRTRVTTPKAA